MTVVHLNKNDLAGGAARAAYRLHKALQRAGQESLMIVESRSSDDPSVRAFERPTAALPVVRRGLRQMWIDRQIRRYRKSRPRGYELFSVDRSAHASTLLDQIPACEVINLHWISGFVDYPSFFTRVPSSTPIVWTLHDLNPLTGGCHYDLGCGRYVVPCGRCPQLGSVDSRDLSNVVWARKQQVFAKVAPSRLHFVTPSRWLAGEVKRSPIVGRFPVSLIPHGLDLEEFRPRNRERARELLEIPRDSRVALFVAEDVGNRRKGFSLLIEALTRCAGRIPNLVLLSLGQNKPEVHAAIPSVHMGSVNNNDRFLSMVYSAADVFVSCSLQEAYGLTVMEAMACGIPVVGFGVGGVADMVRNGVTGLTVAPTDVDALADALRGLLNDGARCAEMGRNARRIAVEEYSVELQARRYAELYASLVRKENLDRSAFPDRSDLGATDGVGSETTTQVNPR